MDDPKVRRINSKKAPGQDSGKKKEDKALSRVRIAQQLCKAINRHPEWIYAEFPTTYYNYEPSAGMRLLLREVASQPNVVELVDEKALINELLAYSWDHLQLLPEFQMTAKTAKDVIDCWLAATPPVPTPKPFSFADESFLTFNRLPWALTSGKTPTWDGLLENLSNARAFKDWIGSLFFPESSTHQYVWCWGAGNDGKGAINRFLKCVFGQSYVSKQPPGRDDKFWAYGLLNKRLVVFPDCDNQSFVATGFFKTLTGGDPMDVQAKMKMAFTVMLSCKFIFFSNERPSLSSDKADQRRVIYCEFRPRDDEEDPQFEERLWNEGGAFLAACLLGYAERYPQHGRILPDSAEIQDWVETIEGEFAEAMDFHFELDAKSSVTPIILQRVLQSIWKDRRRQLGFLAWLERKYGIRKKSDPKNINIKCYRGIRFKPDNGPNETGR